nr:MAG: hypothetical protein CM15mV30_1030 [uncultured marine virus]
MIRISQQNPLSENVRKCIFRPEPWRKLNYLILEKDVLTISEPRPDMIRYYET